MQHSDYLVLEQKYQRVRIFLRNNKKLRTITKGEAKTCGQQACVLNLHGHGGEGQSAQVLGWPLAGRAVSSKHRRSFPRAFLRVVLAERPDKASNSIAQREGVAPLTVRAIGSASSVILSWEAADCACRQPSWRGALPPRALRDMGN